MADQDLRLLERSTDIEDARGVRRLMAARARVGLGFHGEVLPEGVQPDRIEELHPDVQRDPTMPHGLVGVYKMQLVSGVPIEMVYVPGGDFLYGSKEDDAEAYADEKPQVVQHAPGFHVSRGPVSVREFDPTKEKGKKVLHPVVNISWHDATAWVAENKLSLLTEVQWEKMARGTDGRKFAWGDDLDGERMTYYTTPYGKGTTPIGKFPRGSSPYGCLDCNGNVWEWCQDVYSERRSLPGDGARVLRGGSRNCAPQGCRSAFRLSCDPGYRLDRYGFRVRR